MLKKIVIDPGHGGSDPGAVGNGLAEKDINLEIALQLKKELADFCDVSLTRTTDLFVSLVDRAAYANRLGADFFISIHVNSGGGTGFESYVYTNAIAENERLRGIIHKEAAAFYLANGFPDRGMKKANFAVLRDTKMPSTLLENLFIDTAADAEMLKDPNFCKKIAGAIADGLIKALDLHNGNTVPGTPYPPHWADADFQRLVKAGLVQNQHNLNSPVTWGEFSAVVARLLDKLKL